MTSATQSRLGGLQVGILLLTAATALIHLWLGVSAGLIMFILNGLGYLTLAAVGYLPIPPLANLRVLARWALLAFTAVTIIGWVVIGERNTIGFIDKAIEIVLAILLISDLRRK
jgi:hypothetical protein